MKIKFVLASILAVWFSFNIIETKGFTSQTMYYQGFELINNELYYYSDNQRVYGLFKSNDLYYYANDVSGVVKICTGDMKINGKSYYFSSPGIMEKGFVVRDGKLYNFGENGELKIGLYMSNNKYYYADLSGISKICTGEIKLENKVYFFSNQGVMEKGFAVRDGKLYNYGINGEMQIGLYKSNNEYYYADSSGSSRICIGEMNIDGKNYFFSKPGYMETGFAVRDGKLYNYGINGELQTGIYKSNNKYYYADSSGSSRICIGEMNIDGKNYYFSKPGYMETGFANISGSLYHFKDNGVRTQNTLLNIGGLYYHTDASGKVKICFGSLVYNNDSYYFSKPGLMEIGFASYGGNLYYHNQEGKMQFGAQIINDKYYYFNDKTGTMITQIGIDVSEHNHVIDWNKVKSNGVNFAIIRSSWGFYQLDNQFIYNVRECERLGIPYGLYHYSYATNMEQAKLEVDGLMNILETMDLKPDFPIYIDMEDADGWKENNGDPSNEMYQGISMYFCERLIEAGYNPGIYANLDWWTNRLNSTKLDTYEKWVANFGINNGSMRENGSGFYKKHGIWQYTSVGRIDGISTNVDLNLGYIQYNY